MSRSEGSAGSSLRFIVPLIALWLIPLTVAALSMWAAFELEQQAVTDEPPVAVAVGSVEDDARTPVTLTLNFGNPVPLAITTSGVVTSISASQGSTIENGSNLLSVDRRQLRLFVADTPLLSDVSPTSRGLDVTLVGTYLGVDSPSGNYSTALRAAINAWNETGGWPRDGVFRLASVIYAAPGPTMIQSSDLRIGESVGPGSVIGQLQPEASGANFARPDGAPLDPRLLDGQAIAVDIDGTSLALPSTTPDGSVLEELSQAVSGSSTEVLAEGSATYSGLSIRLQSPITYGTVANTAIYVSPTGTACLVLTQGTEIVIIEPSPIGVTQASAVDPALIGEEVVMNVATVPGEILGQCGS